MKIFSVILITYAVFFLQNIAGCLWVCKKLEESLMTPATLIFILLIVIDIIEISFMSYLFEKLIQ